MPWTSKHIKWLVSTKDNIKTVDGKTIEIWEFHHEEDDEILSAWAKHFRNHYCLDTEIDDLRKGYGYSRAEYLFKIKFPDESQTPGPSIRSGDFSEVLVADYLQYILKFWVPRTRYCDKTIRNESIKGCDIIGFKIIYSEKDSPDDILAIYEAKAQFSGQTAKPRLQDAIDNSIKDKIRKGESLNAIKQRLLYKGDHTDVKTVERFQNEEDKPYKEVSGAAALFSSSVYDKKIIKSSDTSKHPNSDNLKLIVIYGEDLMNLAHELYRRAANEA